MSDKRFHLAANCYFYASDIDDAMEKLSEHFAKLGEDGLISAGTIEVTPDE